MRAFITLLFTLTLTCGQDLQVTRWRAAEIQPRYWHEAQTIAIRILTNRARYESVATPSHVPFYVIAGLHNMESGGSFQCHLHEGSPLTGRTRYEPKGRPVTGKPPFTWEFSALDALQYDHMGSVNWTSLHCALYACEAYNGTGYLRFHPSTPTPYLWAGTTVARPGKYVADGQWCPTAISSQIGIVPIWKALQAAHSVDFSSLKQ